MAPSDIFAALVLFPLLEEYIFRQHGLTWLAARQPHRSAWEVNAVVSLCFAVAHLLNWPLAHTVGTFFASLLLGLVMQKTGQWLWCVALHSAMNLCYLLVFRV